jgi:hypothetical protein
MRSNSFVTQRVVLGFKDYLRGVLADSRECCETNLHIMRDASGSDVGLFVNIHENTILSLFRDEKTHGFDSVIVTTGFYYDNDGNPTKIARERLNGLLDALGDENILPKGIRVYVDAEFGVCYLKHEETRLPLSKHYNHFIRIMSDKNSFKCETQEELLARKTST